jgi:tight adherence protein C
MILRGTLILQLASCVSFGFGAFALTYAAFSAPLGNARRLGLRGLKREQLLDRNEAWRFFEPIVRWLGLRFSGLLPERTRESLNRQIGVAGDFMGLLPEELIGFSVLTSVLGLGIGYAAGVWTGMGNLATFGCCAFGLIAPFLTLSDTSARRFKEVNRRLPYAIDLLALGMGAGLDFPAAVRQVVEKSGAPNDPLVEEFTLILQSLQLGRTRRMALEEFAARVPSDAVREFVGAVVQAEMRGNPVVNVLRIQAEVSRHRRTARAEEAAARAGVAMVLPLVLVFITILLLIVAPMIMKIQQQGM